MWPRIARLAGLGAFGAAAGLVAVYGVFVFLTRPTGTSGIDRTSALVTWISVGGMIAALVVLHVVIGRQLLRLGRGTDVRHPL